MTQTTRALKGRHRWSRSHASHQSVAPFQGCVDCFDHLPQGVALGWYVAAPSGRRKNRATSKLALRVGEEASAATLTRSAGDVFVRSGGRARLTALRAARPGTTSANPRRTRRPAALNRERLLKVIFGNEPRCRRDFRPTRRRRPSWSRPSWSRLSSRRPSWSRPFS
jgi:hypothetical protein